MFAAGRMAGQQCCIEGRHDHPTRAELFHAAEYSILKEVNCPHFDWEIVTGRAVAVCNLVKPYVDAGHRPAGWNNSVYTVLKPFAVLVAMEHEKFKEKAAGANPQSPRNEPVSISIEIDGVKKTLLIYQVGETLIG